MNSKLTRRALLGGGLALPFLGGCGGGAASSGSNNGAGVATRGSLSLTLTFPPSRAARASGKTRAFNGNIPLGAQAIQVTVTDPATGANLAPARLITAPTTSNSLPGQVNVQFTALPVGVAVVTAIVFPDVGARQNPIATGSARAQIVANSTANAQITFMLTLAHFTVSNPGVNVTSDPRDPMHTATVDAVVQDTSNRALQYPIYWLSNDPGIAQVTFDPANPTTATITGVADGHTIVTLVEPNTGTTATVDVVSRLT